MDKRPDRRVNRTRRALRDALLALVLEKGYEAVTVEDITESADLGRTTFYLHYRDKEELLLESIGELLDDLVKHVSSIPTSAWIVTGDFNPPDEINPILLTFQHAAQNEPLYRIILRGEGTHMANRRIREIIAQAVKEYLVVKAEKENLALYPQIPIEVFSNYLAASWLGMITWWLESGMPYPPREIAQMFQRILMKGAIEVLKPVSPTSNPGD